MPAPKPKYDPSKLRSARLAKQLTQQEVAQKLGVNPGTVTRWESTMQPSAEQLAKLAELYGVTADSLLA